MNSFKLNGGVVASFEAFHTTYFNRIGGDVGTDSRERNPPSASMAFNRVVPIVCRQLNHHKDSIREVLPVCRCAKPHRFSIGRDTKCVNARMIMLRLC